jgi:hypothetical protein
MPPGGFSWNITPCAAVDLVAGCSGARRVTSTADAAFGLRGPQESVPDDSGQWSVALGHHTRERFAVFESCTVDAMTGAIACTGDFCP